MIKGLLITRILYLFSHLFLSLPYEMGNSTDLVLKISKSRGKSVSNITWSVIW
jgi:hypothetical protein